LKTWGFNTLGAGCDPALRDDALPFIATVGFANAGTAVRFGGIHLPDVYDPVWPEATMGRAATVCSSLADHRGLIGWITDEDLRWGPVSAGSQLTLLQVCLSLEPAAAAYHAAWEFVLALHGGKLDAIGRAWGLPLANKEIVREMARTERVISSRGYLRDDARWTHEFARRYFAVTAAAIRAHDPHHLILGCRFNGRPPASVLAEVRYPAVDIPWVDVDDVPAVEPGPAIAGEFNWTDARFFRAPVARRGRGLTSVERMLRRGRVVLERCARHPALVGYAWSRWQDAAGEQPPFASGLVHVNDVEAREHTELLVDLNARIHDLRNSRTSPSSP
jgi:hypothetical protein